MSFKFGIIHLLLIDILNYLHFPYYIKKIVFIDTIMCVEKFKRKISIKISINDIFYNKIKFLFLPKIQYICIYKVNIQFNNSKLGLKLEILIFFNNKNKNIFIFNFLIINSNIFI